MIQGLPFAHLNLRRNPFGELPPDARAVLARIDAERYAALIDSAPRFALQFVAHSGRGKTTHLLALHARLGGAYVLIPEDGPTPAIPAGPEPLLIDESQRLPRRQLRRLFRGAARLVLGTHEDHSRELSKAGRPFESVTIAGLDAARLRDMLTARIEAARRGPGPVPRLTGPVLSELIARHGDNIRAIEHALYARVQTMEAPVEISL